MSRVVLGAPSDEAVTAPGVVAEVHTSLTNDADWIIVLADGRRFRWPGEYGPPLEIGAKVELVQQTDEVGNVIAVGFKVEVKKSKVLTDGGRALALPLQQATEYLAGMILTRIREGRGPIGPWNTYGANVREGGEALFWVAPRRPQPDGEGLKFKVSTGQWAGWAAYTNARAYYRLRGLEGRPHDFEESGVLLRAAAIRMVNPRHGRLAFYGGHGKLSAKAVAWLASRNESSPLLMPSAEEVERFQRYIAEHLNEQIVEAARMGATAQAMTSRSASISRRASRILGD